MTEQDQRGDQLHAAAATQVTGKTPPPVPSMTTWGRRAALIYLVVGGLVLVGMAVETVLGHPGTFGMFAAFLSVPWSMLVAGFAPPLPANLPLALGLAARMVPLALFMFLNAAIVAGIAARSERDLTGRGAKALLLVVLAGAVSASCRLTSLQGVLVASPSENTQFSGVVATTARNKSDPSHRVHWNEGEERFNANREALGRESMRDGSFTLPVGSAMPLGSPGGAGVDNLRLGATLQVR